MCELLIWYCTVLYDGTMGTYATPELVRSYAGDKKGGTVECLDAGILSMILYRNSRMIITFIKY